MDLSDESLDPLRFALLPAPSAWARWMTALAILARHPNRLGAILWARLRGKRLRARQALASLIGLDHRRLWLANATSEDETPAPSFWGERTQGGTAVPVVMAGGPAGPITGILPHRDGESRDLDRPAFRLHLAPGHTPAAGAEARIEAAFAAEPGIQAVYGDALAEIGGSPLPVLRPAFDPDYLLAVDYIGPVVALRSSALAAIERPDASSPTYAAACLLMIADRFGTGAIRHLPQVLSHWRPDPRGEGGAGHRSARLDLLRRRGLTGRIDEHGVVTVSRPLPEDRPLVSLIVPTRDRLDLLRPCLDSLRHQTDWPACEILICDNDSREPQTHAYFRDLTESGQARVIACPGPFNFAAMNNAAARAAGGRLLAFVNNDVEAFSPDWLERMCREALRLEVGAVGARLLDGEGRIQHGGIVLGTGGLVTHGHRHCPGDALGYLSALRVTRSVSAVTAACLVVEADKFRRVGGFDAETFAVDFNDVDLCLRLARTGWRTLYVGGAVLHHREAASRRRTPESQDRHRREVEAFKKRWGPLLAQDPHYHPGFDPNLGTHVRLARTWSGGPPR
ncbi:glycosyl transferase [Methylobacterium sp. Leaf399]|nr:glycosyl transferase [Methylobacterium sp. Leaf108]KQT07334.1 glycosyl transferase [Methylobacterium sp. Leaf399]KQT76979.1 glycosyl transferase [Methylobacterium sp. Leaf466]